MTRLAVVALATGCFFEPKRPLDPDAPPPEMGPDAYLGVNYVFVTSQTFVPMTLGGLDGADAKCAEAAKAGGLPGTYVAWLSTSSVNAIDRLAAARGWQRRDHNPVFDLSTDIPMNRMRFSPRLDEMGTPVPADAIAITGTGNSGTAVANETCGDYTSITGQYVAGAPSAGSSLWTMTGVPYDCSVAGHLYCFGVDHTTAAVALPMTHPYGFVTTGTHYLNEAAPDQICQTVANARGLGTSYKALLATTTSAAREKFAGKVGPWHRLDGVPFTNADLTAFVEPLAYTDTNSETGGDVFFGAPDLSSVAAATSANCSNWTQGSGFTNTGDAAWATALAFSGRAPSFLCSLPAHYYCLEY